jgi:hypothetical protein
MFHLLSAIITNTRSLYTVILCGDYNRFQIPFRYTWIISILFCYMETMTGGGGEEIQSVIFRTEKGLNGSFMTEYNTSPFTDRVGVAVVLDSYFEGFGSSLDRASGSHECFSRFFSQMLGRSSIRPDRFLPDLCRFIIHRTNDAMQLEALACPRIFLKELRKSVSILISRFWRVLTMMCDT